MKMFLAKSNFPESMFYGCVGITGRHGHKRDTCVHCVTLEVLVDYSRGYFFRPNVSQWPHLLVFFLDKKEITYSVFGCDEFLKLQFRGRQSTIGSDSNLALHTTTELFREVPRFNLDSNFSARPFATG